MYDLNVFVSFIVFVYINMYKVIFFLKYIYRNSIICLYILKLILLIDLCYWIIWMIIEILGFKIMKY